MTTAQLSEYNSLTITFKQHTFK